MSQGHKLYVLSLFAECSVKFCNSIASNFAKRVVLCCVHGFVFAELIQYIYGASGFDCTFSTECVTSLTTCTPSDVWLHYFV